MGENKPTLDYASQAADDDNPSGRQHRSPVTLPGHRSMGIAIGIVVYFIAWFMNLPRR